MTPMRECKMVPKRMSRQVCSGGGEPLCRMETRQVPKEDCSMVPRERCDSVPKEQCRQMPRQKCRSVPREECQIIPKQRCRAVPRQECNEVCEDILWCKVCDGDEGHGPRPRSRQKRALLDALGIIPGFSSIQGKIQTGVSQIKSIIPGLGG